MNYNRARKGVIMTTSTFTKDGLDFVDRIEGKKVVLIDGGRLASVSLPQLKREAVPPTILTRRRARFQAVVPGPRSPVP
jgi:Restriction endonuclease